jgi:hypothetical protein
MRNSRSLIGNMLGVLWLPQPLGPVVGAPAEALHLGNTATALCRGRVN